MSKIRRILYAEKPSGEVTAKTFKIEEAEVPSIKQDGDVLVKVKYLSVDPYLKERMQGEWSFVTPYQLNQVMDSIGLGVVMGSINSPFKKGDIVYGNNFPWQDEFVFDKDKAQKELKKLDKDMNLSHAMGVLGMTGATAYYGFFNIGQPKSGEVVCVTGAGGAVGLVVSQLAMIHGCKGNNES
jgi:NADPH-dependent curcumin reductase CurA